MRYVILCIASLLLVRVYVWERPGEMFGVALTPVLLCAVGALIQRAELPLFYKEHNSRPLTADQHYQREKRHEGLQI